MRDFFPGIEVAECSRSERAISLPSSGPTPLRILAGGTAGDAGAADYHGGHDAWIWFPEQPDASKEGLPR